MKKTLFVLLVVLLFNSIVYSQEVKTLVEGPSTFNDGLAVDKHGNIYAANYYGSEITKITLDGKTEIFADGFDSPNGIAFGPDGYLYVPSAEGNRVDKVSPSGEVTSVISSIKNPTGIAFDKDGNMLIAQYQESKISIYRTNGNLSTFSNDNKLNGPVGLVFDEEQNLYIGNFNDGTILKRTPDGTITQIADVTGWLGFIAYSCGHIYATAYQRNKIYRVTTDGTNFEKFAGTGSGGQVDGKVSRATFDQPNGITSSITGDTLYISDYNTRSLRMIIGVNPTTNIIDNGESLNKNFHLSQNYPNPFNPTTSVEFSLPQTGAVEFNVFNTLGQEVAYIALGKMSAGTHSVDFDGAELTSGVYFYKLDFNGQSQIKKMMLVK